MLVYQKTMFDRYYCIKSFCHLKTLEKTLRKVIFCITIMARKKHEASIGFDDACSRATTYVLLTSLDYVHFYAHYR